MRTPVNDADINVEPYHLDEHAPLWLWRDALQPGLLDGLLERLCEQLPWRQPTVTVYGKRHLTPRLTSWQGAAGIRYRYSGVEEEARGWPDCLEPVLRQGEHLTRHDYNSVLCNWYRDGQDTMGYHSDDEPELGPEPWIASLSLGEPRDFVFRPKPAGRQCLSLTLPHNSLLLMSPAVQHRYHHALPRRAHANGSRINLTFRWITPRTHS